MYFIQTWNWYNRLFGQSIDKNQMLLNWMETARVTPMKHVADEKKNDGRWKTSVWTDEESVAFLNLEHKIGTHPHTS